MTGFATIDKADVVGKRVLLRADLNVPMKNGRVEDSTRLMRVAPTVVELAGKGARVVMAVRDQQKASDAATEIRASVPDAALELVVGPP